MHPRHRPEDAPTIDARADPVRAADDVCWLDGERLVIDLRPLAEAVRIAPWSEGLEVERLDDGRYWLPAPFTRDVRLALELEPPATSALGRFVLALPAHARRAAQRCGAHSLAALRLLASDPRGRVHARTPNLLWLLASYADRSGISAAVEALEHTPENALSICTRGRAVHGALGLLARVEVPHAPEARAAAEPLLVDALASTHAVRLLRHVRPVRLPQLRAALRLGERHRAPLFGKMLAHGATEEKLLDAIDLQRRTAALGRRAGIVNPAGQIARVGLGRLQRLFESWTLRAYRRSGEPDPEALRFPAPPLPGTRSIVPIAHLAMLLDEGDEMRHCIARYEEHLLSGRLVAYRVLGPERATLLIDVASLEILELSGRRNAAIGDEARGMILDWLDREAAKLP